MTFVNALVIAAVLGTLAALVLGLVTMARGGEFNARYGNRLMRLRVLIQGLAVVMLLIAMVLSIG
ncbi:MAG: twin transmembrane helix small protein [Rhodospirillales bacterium]|nr:twin transmembrane helix small protein [Rhodospirillales bacterium]